MQFQRLSALRHVWLHVAHMYGMVCPVSGSTYEFYESYMKIDDPLYVVCCEGVVCPLRCAHAGPLYVLYCKRLVPSEKLVLSPRCAHTCPSLTVPPLVRYTCCALKRVPACCACPQPLFLMLLSRHNGLSAVVPYLVFVCLAAAGSGA